MKLSSVNLELRRVGYAVVVVTFCFLLAGTWSASARRHSVKTSGSADSAAEESATGSTNAPDMDDEPILEMSALAAASKPVQVSSNSTTKAEVQIQSLEFRERQYLQGYLQRGERNPKTDKLALGFLKNWLAENYGGVVDTNLPSFRNLGYQLANDTNCTDPLVLAVYGVSVKDDIKTDRLAWPASLRERANEKPSVLERALKGFENSKHRGWPKFFAATELAKMAFADYSKDNRIPAAGNPILQLDLPALKYFQESLADGSIQPDDQAEVGEVLINGWGATFFQRNAEAVLAAVETRGVSFRWLAQTLRGEKEIQLAWAARGNGMADTVTEDGWKGFNQHLALARKALNKAWRLDPSEPLAPSRMIYVSLGSSGIGEMRQWFDRTVAAQFDNDDAWRQMRWGLRPRWHGDLDCMMAFGLTALNTRRFDTGVPLMFLRSVLEIQSENHDQFILRRTNVWPHLETMFNGYIGAATNDEQRAMVRGRFAAAAFIAGKQEVAAQQLQLLNWQPPPESLLGWNQDLSGMALTVEAHNVGPLKQQIKDMEQRNRLNPREQNSAVYQSLLDTPEAKSDEWTRKYLESQLAKSELRARLSSQQWGTFMPANTNLSGWQIEQGKFQLLPDGSLEAQAGRDGHLIYCRQYLGTEFEIRGVFEVETTNQSSRAGIVFGLPQIGSAGWHAVTFQQNPALGQGISVSRGWLEKEFSSFVPGRVSTNSFFVRFQHGYVTASLNDQELISVFQLQDRNLRDRNRGFQIGLGAYNDNNTTTVRYRNIEIKLLPPENTIGSPR